MYRTVRTFAVLIAAVGAISIPTQAFADDEVTVHTTTITVIGTGNQLAGGEITNVGGDAIIGSFDGIDVH
ncbi:MULTISPECIES: hypothetical protein [unclassified Streptomyces]|uniref:hypothetical protein n=1 Tax=unclassified Streptomyces TaxID=2593676 RepID=UPI0005F8BA74|nr:MULTISPECIES: hypothetical protein [unclassified Streptomyces]KJY35015.1 hypothetical protein VR45_15270 [Streptomyces sp. NRRL S-495]KOV36793.1 hypothetical protein ADK60_06205 [Streptomyces sp. XY431]